MNVNISAITHPLYLASSVDWLKWRTTYNSGVDFITAYLRRYSARETVADFDDRKAITYCPAFAKVGINEVRDSIYNRMVDITRAGGTPAYQEAISGKNSGVDLYGSSMNFFMGCKILPELLTMQKVGIYVDMPPLMGSSVLENTGLHPYIYMFPVENIRNWVLDEDDTPNEFASILLQEEVFEYDDQTGFPIGYQTRYRRLWKDENGQVLACFYNSRSEMVDQFGNVITEPIPLAIKKIPFILLDIGESLMCDIADYQIALLNLASSDMAYALKSNFPFYVEQYDPKWRNLSAKPGKSDSTDAEAKVEEVNVGVSKGRRYPKDTKEPAFIHPSPEPLLASMKKQEQLKMEIRQLLKLAITSLAPPTIASAESKKQDTRTLENGLSYIGLTLEHAERKIAEYWSMYEGSKEVATVNYPLDYSLYGEEERRGEADYLQGVQKSVPSKTFQQSVQKRLVKTSMGSKLATDTLKTIEQEIEKSESLSRDPDVILLAVEAGLCDNELASKLLGYPAGTVEKAKKDHVDRLTRITIAQTEGAAAARGLPDAGTKTSGAAEKKTSDGTSKKTRGKGRFQ